MYKRIAIAIEREGCGTHPSDHLSFYCLGKREGPEDLPDCLADTTPDTAADTVRHTLRHPIYVHSKLMIVDDDYIGKRSLLAIFFNFPCLDQSLGAPISTR